MLRGTCGCVQYGHTSSHSSPSRLDFSFYSDLLYWKQVNIFFSVDRWCSVCLWSLISNCGRVRLKPDGTRWRTGGEVKEKLANGVGSQYSHTTSERGVSSITNADAHTSAASSRLNWRPHRFNGLVRFGERRNLVSARVPSRSARAILSSILHFAVTP